jgi:hypothetical protein
MKLVGCCCLPLCRRTGEFIENLIDATQDETPRMRELYMPAATFTSIVHDNYGDQSFISRLLKHRLRGTLF